MPKVSIIIPCYNKGKYLADTLSSIINSRFKDWECIIINDGSTDNSEEVALSYLKLDKRIKYYYQENKGVCSARNNAEKMCSGKYLIFIDGDDLISDIYLGECVKVLDEDESVKLVTCNFKKFGKYHKKFLLEPYSIERLMGHNLWINAGMIRKKDFDLVGGFNEKMNHGLEDWDFWLSLLEKGGNVKYLKGFHFFYRICGFSRNDNTRSKESLIALRKQIWYNHKELYGRIYSSPFYSEEYLRVANSYEYKIGKFLFSPIRYLFSKLGL